MVTRVDRRVGPWAALAADVAVVVVFVLIGRRSHHEDAGFAGFLRAWWPFAVGLAVAWFATGLRRMPLAWSRAVAAWLLTVAVGMALRIAVEGHGFSIAFTVVTLVFVGAGMLGWRRVVCWRRGKAATGARTPGGAR